ncbi:MAG: hypothetical protein DCF17_16230 [Shackletoniella antarctica]|uniref:NACHT N-terminal Helical domain-containing protein n=1 Tax=Shackletoniella antarctica TaxID=268115 RepID=A0A2W4W5G7_9CYAN|nr:MAG: hypothetical protein DCF17_16230 [Shackletoniella antarctica]
MATRLWDFLTTDSCDRAINAERAADAADAVLGLAAGLATEGPTSPKLAPLVLHLDSLLDAINAPLGKLVGSTLPLADLGTGLLMFYRETTQTEPTLAQAIALVSQAAYLESFRELVKRNPRLGQLLTDNDSTPRARTITLEVKALGIFELTDSDAQLATVSFHQSALAAAFNRALKARLEQIGMPATLASRLVETVAKNTNRHIKKAIAAADDRLKTCFELPQP